MDLNDIADYKTSERVFADFIELSTLVKKGIETCLLVYISIKPIPSGWMYCDKMKMTNDLIKLYVSNHDNPYYLDTSTPMIGKNGRPKPYLFTSDSLQLSEEGYDMWSSAVNSSLDSTLVKGCY